MENQRKENERNRSEGNGTPVKDRKEQQGGLPSHGGALSL